MDRSSTDGRAITRRTASGRRGPISGSEPPANRRATCGGDRLAGGRFVRPAAASRGFAAPRWSDSSQRSLKMGRIDRVPRTSAARNRASPRRAGRGPVDRPPEVFACSGRTDERQPPRPIHGPDVREDGTALARELAVSSTWDRFSRSRRRGVRTTRGCMLAPSGEIVAANGRSSLRSGAARSRRRVKESERPDHRRRPMSRGPRSRTLGLLDLITTCVPRALPRMAHDGAEVLMVAVGFTLSDAQLIGRCSAGRAPIREQVIAGWPPNPRRGEPHGPNAIRQINDRRSLVAPFPRRGAGDAMVALEPSSTAGILGASSGVRYGDSSTEP